MHLIAKTADDFRQLWNGERNFLIHSALFKFEMPLIPAEEVIDILRRDSEARIQFLDDSLSDAEQNNLVEKFKAAPIEKAVEMPISLAHFHLQNFYGAGQFLEHFQECVMILWRTFLSQLGFTWQRCYPIIFISGKGCSSTYHADSSHVLAWQVYGKKHFHGFLEPEKREPVQKLVEDRTGVTRIDIPQIDPADILTYDMQPGDLLWNQLLTPHWVDAGEDEVAMSFNISHGGVAYRGEFCPNEQVLRQHWEKNPKSAWLVDERY